MVTFGDRVRQAREARGMSLRQLAAKTGVSHIYIYDIELGNRQQPSYHLIGSLASALGISADPLYYAAGYIPPDARGHNWTDEQIAEAFDRLRPSALVKGQL